MTFASRTYAAIIMIITHYVQAAMVALPIVYALGFDPRLNAESIALLWVFGSVMMYLVSGISSIVSYNFIKKYECVRKLSASEVKDWYHKKYITHNIFHAINLVIVISTAFILSKSEVMEGNQVLFWLIAFAVATIYLKATKRFAMIIFEVASMRLQYISAQHVKKKEKSNEAS